LKISPTEIPDVLLIEPHVFGDERGFFLESYREEDLLILGVDCHFVQDNHSGSKQGVLRGLHYQIRQPQGKLVRALRGQIYDTVVDLRRSSATFGKWVGRTLTEENKHQLYIPAGFAHGFLVLSDWAEILYKATDYYAPEWERTLLWNDPALAIEWPLVPGMAPALSVKDARGLPLSQAESYQ